MGPDTTLARPGPPPGLCALDFPWSVCRVAGGETGTALATLHLRTSVDATVDGAATTSRVKGPPGPPGADRSIHEPNPGRNKSPSEPVTGSSIHDNAGMPTTT